MTEQENVQVVQRIYQAFGAGDIPGVLALLTEDVEFRLPGPSDIPFAGTHRGHEELARFFTLAGENAEIELFEAREFIAQGDRVVVLGHERAKARSTGKGWDTDWAMVWTVRDGKAASVQEFHETATIAAAFRG